MIAKEALKIAFVAQSLTIKIISVFCAEIIRSATKAV